MLWQATRRGGLGPAVSRRRRSAVGHRWRRGCGRPGAGATAWTGGESEMPRVRSEGGARRAARDGGEACRGASWAGETPIVVVCPAHVGRTKPVAVNLGWADTNSCRLPSPRRPHNPVAVNLGWRDTNSCRLPSPRRPHPAIAGAGPPGTPRRGRSPAAAARPRSGTITDSSLRAQKPWHRRQPSARARGVINADLVVASSACWPTIVGCVGQR